MTSLDHKNQSTPYNRSQLEDACPFDLSVLLLKKKSWLRRHWLIRIVDDVNSFEFSSSGSVLSVCVCVFVCVCVRLRFRDTGCAAAAALARRKRSAWLRPRGPTRGGPPPPSSVLPPALESPMSGVAIMSLDDEYPVWRVFPLCGRVIRYETKVCSGNDESPCQTLTEQMWKIVSLFD